jgi:hypothetical protein
MRRKTFALPDWGGTVWSWLLPAGLLGGLVLLDKFGPDIALPDVFAIVFVPLLPLPHITVALFFAWCIQKHRESQYAREARKLGLRFSTRVTEQQLAPYSSHLLFAATANFKRYAGYWLEGELNGCQVQVFVYRYAGKVRLANGRRLWWVGYHSVCLVPGLDGVPDFLLTPEAGEYELTDVVAGWLRGVERDEVALELKVGEWTMALRGRDEVALRHLFSTRHREAMGLWWGWWAECLDGKLLVYTERAVVESDGLAGALQAWVGFANALSAAARSLPGSGAPWRGRDPRLRQGPADRADDPRLRSDQA